MSGPRRINIVSVFIYLVIGLGVYASIQYAPLYWKQMKLENLVKDESYGAKRSSPDQVTETLITRAGRELGILLEPEDIQIVKTKDRVRVHVNWRVSVEHPLVNKTTQHLFTVDQDTVFY